jgi:anti-sigma factor RsiW
MFGFHIKGQLAAYCHGELPAADARRVAQHLERCGRCREEYEDTRLGIALAGTLRRVEAPESLWSEIESALRSRAEKDSRQGRKLRWMAFGWRPLAVAAGVLVVVLGIVATRQSGPPASDERVSAFLVEVDLGDYLRPVQVATVEASYAAISNEPPHFESRDRNEVSGAAGLGGDYNVMPPLPGYALLAHRALKLDGNEVVQLVYGNGREAFSVFVAPGKVTFRYGDERPVEMVLGGIVCQKVDCPKQETYAFREKDFSCVLVSKSFGAQQAAAVMRYFISAHRKSD